jgi:hypothetical protein
MSHMGDLFKIVFLIRVSNYAGQAFMHLALVGIPLKFRRTKHICRQVNFASLNPHISRIK